MPTRRVDGFHWTAEVTVPRTEKHSWAQNKNIDIICATAERAMEIVRQQEPTVVIHVIRKVGRFNGTMYVDEAVFDPEPETSH